MNECTSCQKELSDYRYHLGYTECVDCSKEEKYSAHQVYPHKTGGFVQPVKHETKEHLQKIDRRSTGGRTAKGIFSDQSWDRWLDSYYENLYNPKPKKVFVDTPSTLKHIDYDTLFNKAIIHYKENGYQLTMDWLKSLFNEDKISLGNKSKIVNEINNWEVLPKRLRKWAMKIK